MLQMFSEHNSELKLDRMQGITIESETNHPRKKRRALNNKEDGYTCMCGKTYQSNASWINHIKIKHPTDIEGAKLNSKKPEKTSLDLGRPPNPNLDANYMSRQSDILTSIEMCILKVHQILHCSEEQKNDLTNSMPVSKSELKRQVNILSERHNLYHLNINYLGQEEEAQNLVFNGVFRISLKQEITKYFNAEVSAKLCLSICILQCFQQEKLQSEFFYNLWAHSAAQMATQLRKCYLEWIALTTEQTPEITSIYQ